MNVPVGFSTGCVWQFDIPLAEKLRAFLDVGASAVEVKVYSFSDAFDETIQQLCSEFSFVSIHAPTDQRISSRKQLEFLEGIRMFLGASAITLHPDSIDDISVFEGFDAFAVESMDIEKDSFQRPEEFQEFSAFKGVIDVQHVYETDPSMKLVEDFVHLFGSSLSHVHVSGQNPHNVHAALHEAENAQSILAAIPANVPIILESDLSPSTDIRSALATEFDFVTREI